MNHCESIWCDMLSDMTRSWKNEPVCHTVTYLSCEISSSTASVPSVPLISSGSFGFFSFFSSSASFPPIFASLFEAFFAILESWLLCAALGAATFIISLFFAFSALSFSSLSCCLTWTSDCRGLASHFTAQIGHAPVQTKQSTQIYTVWSKVASFSWTPLSSCDAPETCGYAPGTSLKWEPWRNASPAWIPEPKHSQAFTQHGQQYNMCGVVWPALPAALLRMQLLT